MKKMFLFALAALCVSLVQAVTVTWTGAGAEAVVSGTLSQTVSFASADRFYVSVLLEGNYTTMWNNATAGNARPDMVTLKDSNGAVVLDLNFRKSGGWYVLVNGTDKRLDNYLSDITITLEATKSAGVWSDIAYTLSAIHPTDGDTRTHTGTLSSDLITDIASVELGAPIGGTAMGAVTVTATATASVPEPTALALLALGVAGLSLRRRAA